MPITKKIGFRLLLGIASLALLLPHVAHAQGDSKRPVSVLYAGSLTAAMEKGIGPAFTKSTGYQFQGEAQGSSGAANMIRDGLRHPDVFISADPTLNNKLLMGAANHDLVKWYVTFAAGELVIGYNPKSKFAAQLNDARDGNLKWYDVLTTPGLKFGRTDPDLDPKGYRALFLLSAAEAYYHKPDLRAALAGPQTESMISPEPELLARMEAGQVDAAVFYKHELTGRDIPYISLPAELNESDPAMAKLYAEQTYTTKKQVVMRGAPILFSAAIPVAAPNPDGAVAFVQFLLSPPGQTLLQKAGLDKAPIQAGGDTNQIPPEIKKFVQGAYQP